MLIAKVECRAADSHAHTCRDAVGAIGQRAVVVEALVVAQHSVGHAIAGTQSQHRQRLNLRTHTQRVRALEVILELLAVHLRNVVKSCRDVLHADAVVPVALVIHRQHSHVSERVRRSEHQSRRRSEVPRIGCHVVQHGCGVACGVEVGTHICLIAALESVICGGMHRHAQAQRGDGTVDRAELEVHARTLDIDRLIVVHPRGGCRELIARAIDGGG